MIRCCIGHQQLGVFSQVWEPKGASHFATTTVPLATSEGSIDIEIDGRALDCKNKPTHQAEVGEQRIEVATKPPHMGQLIAAVHVRWKEMEWINIRMHRRSSRVALQLIKTTRMCHNSLLWAGTESQHNILRKHAVHCTRVTRGYIYLRIRDIISTLLLREKTTAFCMQKINK